MRSDEFVRVRADGSARELRPDEIEYLNTDFHGADGARPYIKGRYESLDGWGLMSGFLLRRALPPDVSVLPADAEDLLDPIEVQLREYTRCLRAGEPLPPLPKPPPRR